MMQSLCFCWHDSKELPDRKKREGANEIKNRMATNCFGLLAGVKPMEEEDEFWPREWAGLSAAKRGNCIWLSFPMSVVGGMFASTAEHTHTHNTYIYIYAIPKP